MLEIADNSSYDDKVIETPRGEKLVVDHESIHRSKVPIDTRKWLAAKLMTKKYGDHTQVKADVTTHNLDK
ncbi:MAG: hypothetical protein DHS20C01_32460 [marine bacterium B5-7]|nr:MAG: hypothetical protein DHS20C01_32460 [marine bacterium B5-7]